MNKLAFVFPGQGAQTVGMGKDFCEKYDVAKRLFREADEALGYSIKKMCFEGPAEDLKLTANTQPAILTMSVIAYEILKEHLALRERMRPYIKDLMTEAHEKGSPVIRPLFYDTPEDPECWEIEDEFQFGPDVLVAPVLYAGMRKRQVYLPAGSIWTDLWTGKQYEGGAVIEADAPMEHIPVFTRNGRRSAFCQSNEN